MWREFREAAILRACAGDMARMRPSIQGLLRPSASVLALPQPVRRPLVWHARGGEALDSVSAWVDLPQRGLCNARQRGDSNPCGQKPMDF